ncbi:hypothetical protein B0T19DRAFT_403426 [Cercophora scortea]|uniref:Uncharacterized protein n=1 Tax=Cercophora scortea TaxID=314031 RepID=A0AAE0M631_9PEZI|nr:hypothetical protein B0T19DRAFT_403426 [Cercophora scortea]
MAADEPLLVALNEEPIEDGEFRTSNEKGQKFRPNPVDRGNQLATRVDIVGITHGKFAKTTDSATLLVFELRFLATGGRRFKRATVMVRFEDAEGVSARDPVVHAITPRDRWALNQTTRVRDVKWSANAGVNANAGVGLLGLGGEAGVQWEMAETKTRIDYTALTGEKRVMRPGWTGEANTVIWTLEENTDKSDGIPTFLRAAVLLRRRPEAATAPFSFTVKVKTDVDFIGTIKTLFGLERKDPIDPVEIDPARFPEAFRATIQSLDPTVHDLNKMDRLKLRKVAGVLAVTVLDGNGLIAAAAAAADAADGAAEKGEEDKNME